MTEYDYSPEAYERYMATQNRIAKWVDQTERHRPQFETAVPGRTTQSQPGRLSKPRRRPSEVHVPNPDDDFERYSDAGPGPMPVSSPGFLYYPQQQQPVYSQPLASPPIVLPQQYVITPPVQSSPQRRQSRRSHHSHSHRSRSSQQAQSSGYFTVTSPPMSPGYQYMYPQSTVTGAPASYVVMPPSQPGQPTTYMATPLSAPPSINVTSGAYFSPQPSPPAPAQTSATVFIQNSYSTPSIPGTWATYGVSPPHSVASVPTGTVMVSPPTSGYFMTVPQQTGGNSSHSSTHYLAPPVAYQSFILPQGATQHVYDLSNRQTFRHSVG